MIQHSNTAEEAVAFEDLPIAIPSLVLHILTTCDLSPSDLAILEKTCKFFRHPGSFGPEEDLDLSIAEVAALDLGQRRSLFGPMSCDLKRKCGGSWKLVLRYLKAREFCCRIGKPQAIAGPGHSIVLTPKGAVYSFGFNASGQLGLGKTDQDNDDTVRQPCLIRSLQGIKIVQVAVGDSKTMLVSDAGRVYAMGQELFGYLENSDHEASIATVPKMVESLKDIFVVQVAIGKYFTAVLSGEGTAYTMCWGGGGGGDGILGHQSDVSGVSPTPLLGELENRPVVQISAGNCYLLALVCEPSGMSVYSVGCGMGGKLGHGSESDEKHPRRIQELENLNVEPLIISAGAWHAAVVAKDGRVCTWGWGYCGCLGHDEEEEFVSVPKVVQELTHMRAVNVATGLYTTFVITEHGSVYSSGIRCEPDGQTLWRTLIPKLNQSLVRGEEWVVGINATNSGKTRTSHTFAVTESGKLYASGSWDKGQLGVKLQGEESVSPTLVAIDLS